VVTGQGREEVEVEVEEGGFASERRMALAGLVVVERKARWRRRIRRKIWSGEQLVPTIQRR
jgi:hypothetical protein